MTNYIVMWERDGNEGFDFVNAEDEDSAIELRWAVCTCRQIP
jgi:hypothetical protein